ncbi:hypothetical protein [Streptomyces boncukensis]|uniref:Uncharacterized protein n=1 Tax=Streptomyces boncukensis TaxID=2711219 RepID=A0A6G4WX28_9ACTN|nr:hypothetical protein [Streptomyces boncukensis]NGO69167.1 hypothetical protein [Streptomyces boncukensis]
MSPMIPSQPPDTDAAVFTLAPAAGPVLPWAARLDAGDLHEFLGDLAAAALHHYHSDPRVPDADVLAGVEQVLARWQRVAEGGESR